MKKMATEKGQNFTRTNKITKLKMAKEQTTAKNSENVINKS